jgi:hypothetical protein
VQRRHLLDRPDEPASLGLFWPVGKRRLGGTEEVINLLLRRGEDINAPCGPFGTAVHSLVESFPDYGPGYRALDMLDLLLRKGADINAPGPHRTPLEFVWKAAITSRLPISLHEFFIEMILGLIKRGGVNNRPDPNGIIPSVKYMKNWAHTERDKLLCKYHYERVFGNSTPIRGTQSQYSDSEVAIPEWETSKFEFETSSVVRSITSITGMKSSKVESQCSESEVAIPGWEISEFELETSIVAQSITSIAEMTSSKIVSEISNVEEGTSNKE